MLRKFEINVKDIKKLLSLLATQYNCETKDIIYRIIFTEYQKNKNEVFVELIEIVITEKVENDNIIIRTPDVSFDDIDNFIEKIDPRKSLVLKLGNKGVFIKIEKDILSVNEIIDFLIETNIVDFDMEKITFAFENIGEEVQIAKFVESAYQKPEMNLRISEDEMFGYLKISKKGYFELLTYNDIVKFLTNNGVKIGFLDKIIHNILKDRIVEKEVLILEGREPKHGKDSTVKYLLKKRDLYSRSLYILKTDIIDIKKYNFNHYIKKGTILGVKSEKTKGINGSKITGKSLPAKNGFEMGFKYGKNIELDQEEIKIKSKINGVLNYDNDGILIENLKVINEINQNKGNFDFIEFLLVKGSIIGEISIKSEKDIEIKKDVEYAKIESKNNIIIRGNCLGNNNSILKAGNDIIFSSIENYIINSNRDILFDNVIKDSKTTCLGKIIGIENNSYIVGGEISACGGIIVDNLGDIEETPTLVKVANVNKISDEIKALDIELSLTKDKLENIYSEIRIIESEKIKDYDLFTAEKEENLKKLKILRKDYKRRIEDFDILFEKFGISEHEALTASIRVRNDLYPGVKIKIFDATFEVERMYNNVRIEYANGDIDITSLNEEDDFFDIDDIEEY